MDTEKGMSGYDEDLGKLLNVKIAEIDDFESKFTSKVNYYFTLGT